MNSVIAVKPSGGRAVIAAGLRGRQGERGEQGAPFLVDAQGLLANRSQFDGEPEDFSYLATDTGDLYFRTGAPGGWSDPVPFQGPRGYSAYAVAVANGFSGTEVDWLEFLRGADGRGIASLTIDGSNHLIITYTDGSSVDAGLIPEPASSTSWGDIVGTLSAQTDLMVALNAKADSSSLSTVATSGSYADLTSKPAIPTTAAEVGAIPATEKGAALGVATLDASSKVPAAQLPSYVDDVIEAANFAALPGTGESGKIYVTLDDNKSWRWSGSAYVEISASPGSTDAVPEGSTNKYFTESRVRSSVLTGLSLLAGGAITAADSVLSALGRLQKQISDAITAIGGKQDTLVSGTSLKTVNGSSLLGAGDISITAGAPLAQVVEYTGAAKTLALTDINTVIDCTSGSAVTITIPPQSSVTWTADAEIHVRMSGTGVVSIAVGAGVTVPPLTAPVALAGQGAMVTLKRRSSDVWAVVGLSNIESVVRDTPLTGLSTASDAAVVAADTVLQAFGKLQAQATHVEITSALGV